MQSSWNQVPCRSRAGPVPVPCRLTAAECNDEDSGAYVVDSPGCAVKNVAVVLETSKAGW